MLIHTVKDGETLTDIAAIYGLSAEYIAKVNSYYQKLVPGQELIIVYPAVTHTVKAGESLFSVARDYNTDISALLRNNPFLNNGLNAGDEITIAYSSKKQGNITLNGYCYTFIGFELFRRILPYLSYVTIFTYGFDESGKLIPPYPADDIYIKTASEYGTAPLMHLSTLTSAGSFSSALAAFLLSNEGLWDELADNILANIEEKGYKGLDIDFEYLSAEFAEPYAAFTALLRRRLNERGYILIIALAPKTSAAQQGLLYEGHSYKLLGQSSDLVMPMTYEWGYAYSEPMAVAPINSVNRVIEYALSEIPSNKILLGLPFYGYDWQLPYEKGITVGRSLSPEFALQLGREYNGIIKFDESSASPFMTYFNGDTEHIVWFESPKSIQAKTALIARYYLAGAGIWSIDRPFWQGYMTINLMYDIKKFY